MLFCQVLWLIQTKKIGSEIVISEDIQQKHYIHYQFPIAGLK
jgi:hypothetical protein